jgi:predicted RNA-binding protein (virulence factor B family)
VGEIKFDGFYIKTEKLLVAKFHETRVKNEFENLSSEDLSIIVENSVEAGVVISTAKEFFDFVEAVEEFKGKSLGENKKSLLIRIKFSPEKVLEFQDLKQRLINKLAESLKATVRTLI